MKILCVGYYDKFSRFFIKIKKELEKETPNLEFKINSVFFSGFFYAFIRNVQSSFLPYKAWINVLLNKKKYQNILKKHLVYKNIHLETLIDFHLSLNTKISKKYLQLQALSYIDILDKEFINYNPNIALLIGDSRLAIEVTKALAKAYNTKVYFIEQGPFNSIFFNLNGVNANTKITKVAHTKNKNEVNRQVNEFLNSKSNETYSRSPIYRGFDYIFDLIFGSTKLYPPDLKHTDTFPIFLNNQHKKRTSISLKEKIYFFTSVASPFGCKYDLS